MPRFLPIFALLAVAALLRFHDLPGRVMHTDEAIHAVTVGRLLDGEAFRYDPRDFHGPTLHYSTIPVALARQQDAFAKLDESTMRGVTAAYGVVLVLLTFAFRRELGTPATWMAAWLCAISPMMVFFSRYYIMEMLFAVFMGTFALCCWRWRESGKWSWLAGAGVSLGLMHATKETFVIHIAALAAAAALAGGKSSLAATLPFLRHHWKPLLAMGGLGFLVSAALLSHGFQRPQAILDGIQTYLLYFKRAEGVDAGHSQPLHWYFTTLFGIKPAGGFLYSEIGILILAIAGGLLAFLRPSSDPVAARFHRILALYAAFTAAAYSAIPYKTPWSFLATTHAFILLAGISLAAAIPARLPRPAGSAPARPSPQRLPLAVGMLALALTTAHSLLYVKKITIDAPAAAIQPMVYGHTSQEFHRLVGEISRLQDVEGRTLDLLVAEEENGWPMPWYRRGSLGHNRYGSTLPVLTPAPDIVAVSAALFPDAAQALMATHACRAYPLRPGVNLHVFFRRSLAGMPAPVRPMLRAAPAR